MSDQTGPAPPSRTTLHTRVLVVGVFVGALVTMSLSWLFSWGPESERDKAEREAERIIETRTEAFRSPPGSCLNWNKPDAGDVHKVGCDQEHLFEVAGVADISDEYPPGAPEPGKDTWHALTEERCGAVTHEYLPTTLDPQGKLTLGVLRPDAQQWDEGERILHCGLQWAGPGGELQPLTEPAAEMDQSDVWDLGTCLALSGKTVGDPIACSKRHSYEVTGVVDLRHEFDEFPSLEEQKEWLDQRCSEITEDYTGGKDLTEEGLIMSWDTRERESWDAGSTRVNCKVGAVLSDDSGLAPVHGSVQKTPDPPESDAEETPTESGTEEPAGG